ncbi:MAG: homoserine dehydrogenase [Roseiflexaceae bacterium]
MADTTIYRLALIGFGSAGQGLAKILRDHGESLARRYGVEMRIVAVCTRTRGSLYDPDGLDSAALLEAITHDGHLHNLARQRDWSPLDMIEQADADVLVELSPTDLTTGEPATSHMRAALSRNMHTITANKGPIALHLTELRHLASNAQLYLGYEGTVMSGTPALRLGWSDLAGCEVLELRGIVNGTTNYILTQMESGMSYADALAEAQRLGYAEADPTGDVEGYDAAAKAVILANILMDARLGLGDVERAGITTLTRDNIEAARDSGERWKLIARVWRDGEQVRASVQPTRLLISHPLASAGGATNALTITTDLLGDVTLIGPGAGGAATGFAIIPDILALHMLWGRQ